MASANQVSQLFVALYNRAIDATTARKYAGSAFNEQLVNNIIADNGGITETGRGLIERLYKNALGKNPSDDLDGINYWTSLAEGKKYDEKTGTFEANASGQPLSRGATVMALINSINAWSTDGAMQRPEYMNETQWAAHTALARAGADVFGAKVSVSNAAATRVGGDAGAANLTFDGSGGLENITKDNYKTAVDNNLAKIEGLALRYPAPQAGGNDITLGGTQTSALPTLPEGASAGSYKVTTANDDNIFASIPQSGAAGVATLQATTKIDAGKGYDTLTVDMGNSFEGFNGANAGISGVEKIVLTNTTLNENINFNALGIRDVYTYVVKGSNGINLQNIDYNEYLLIELDGVANTQPSTTAGNQTGGVTNITFNNRPAGGELNLSLKNVGAASDDTGRTNHNVQFGIGSGSYIGNAANDALAGIQMLNIAVSGRNYVDIANTAVTSITVTGNGTLDTNLSAGVNYFNAAAAAGNLTIRATDPKTGGANATGVFDYFSTGEGNDKVFINVSRLAQNAVVDLGSDKYDATSGQGGDTLILTGEVDNVARTNKYNFNTIEHLVFNTTTQNVGDALIIDLGTVSENQQTGEEEVTNEDGTTSKAPTYSKVQVADRSADLKTITFQDAANVRLTGLGDKDLSVVYNGATTGQNVLVDTAGDINLVLGGADTDNGDNTTGDGKGKLGAGSVELNNTKVVNLELTGQGFEGYLKLGKAETLNITNFTGDKKLKLLANELGGDSNHLVNVSNLTINTTARGDNGNTAQNIDDSVDLRAATLPNLELATLIGTGGIQLGDITTRKSVTIDGNAFSGRLLLGDVSAKPEVNGITGIYGSGAGTLSITTKGAITTGTLTGSNVSINLSQQIETADGLANNNIGDIVLMGDATGKADLSYATGWAGTLYQEQRAADLGGLNPQPVTLKDTQTITANSKVANITLDGTTGVDKFNIIAGQSTTEINLKGSLGAANATQIANNDFDKLTIDLSNSNGVKLVSDVAIDTRNGVQGIEIIASKGADTITLNNSVAETIQFSVGDTRSGVTEKYSMDLGSLKLEQGETFTIDGVTVVALASAGLTANQIADALAVWSNSTSATSFAAAKIEGPNGTATAVTAGSAVSITGDFNSLVGNWSGTKLSHTLGKADLVFDSQVNNNISDLNLTWGANTQVSANPGAATKAYAKASAALAGVFDSAGAEFTKVQAADITDGDTAVYAFSLGDQTIEFGVKASGGNVGATGLATFIVNLLTGASAGVLANASEVYYNGNVYTSAGTLKIAELKLAETLALGNFAFSNPSDKAVAVSVVNPLIYGEDQKLALNLAGDSTIVDLKGRVDARDGLVEIAFSDLMAGHSYEFNGKTIVATRDLSGNEVANAFASTSSGGTSFDGGVIVTDWTDTLISKTNALFTVANNVLTITDSGAATGITANVSSTLKTTQPNLLDTNGVKATTTDGVSANPTVESDSYITFSAKTETSVVANQRLIDTLSNFDSNIDKLAIKKFSGESFTSNDVIAAGKLGFAAADQFTDATAGALIATATNGIIDFSWATPPQDATAPTITLDQKLYYATHITGATNKVMGFYDANDFYLVALGGVATSTTDDLVIKLDGIAPGTVANVTDILG